MTFKDDSGAAVKAVAYQYDAFDRKVQEAVDTTSPFDFTDAVLTYFIYDGEDVIIDLRDEDGSGAGAASVHRRYLHGPAIDQVLAQEDAANGVLWHLTDNLGSTRDLIESDGTLAAHFEYDSFGNLIDGRSQTTRYLFTGREYDHHSGLNYHRARWYDPHSGRWISEDPSGLGPDSNPRAIAP